MQRRTFLALSLATLAGIPLVKWALSPLMKGATSEKAKGPLPFSPVHQEDLRAITWALLPESLGRARSDLVLDDFLTWLQDQDPAAELNHSAHQAPGVKRKIIESKNYLVQLSELKAKAGARELSVLDRKELRSLIDPFLTIPKTGVINRFPTGENLFWDLATFFFTSSLALDLFYGKKIGKQTPRKLAEVRLHPEDT